VTAIFILVTIAVFALSWGAFDVYILYRYGINSGKTLSWYIYSQSKLYPAIPLIVGLVIGMLLGHLFLDMNQ
jgi:hypothetical protein